MALNPHALNLEWMRRTLVRKRWGTSVDINQMLEEPNNGYPFADQEPLAYSRGRLGVNEDNHWWPWRC